MFLDPTQTSFRLPNWICCPLCDRKTLLLSTPWRGNRVWASCPDCEFAGEPWELLSRIWDLDDRSTFKKLRQLGFGVDVDHDDKSFANQFDKLRTFRDFWRLCVHNARIHLNKTTSELLLANEVRGVLGDAWAKSPARFLFGVSSLEEASKVRGKLKSPYKHLLVLPFGEQPGTVCGFNLYKADGLSVKASLHHGDRGFWGLEVLGAPLPANLIISPDVLDSLRRHVRHLSSHKRPLPLIAMDRGTEDVNTAAWSGVPTTAVLWSPARTLSVFAKASYAEIAVSHHPANNQVSPYLFEKIRRDAKPWRVALVDWISSLKPPQIRLLVANWGTTHPRLVEALEEGLPEPIWEVVQDSLNPQQIERRLTIRGIDYIENGGAWYVLKGRSGRVKTRLPTLVSPYVIRLDEVLCRRDMTDDRDAWYHGRIIGRNKKVVPFYIRSDYRHRIDNRLNAIAMRAGLQSAVLPSTKATPSNYPLFDLAMAFSKPKLLPAYPRVGWSEEDNAVILPGWMVRRDGSVEAYHRMRSPETPIPRAYRNELDDDPAIWDAVSTYRECSTLFWSIGMFAIASLIRQRLSHAPGGLAIRSPSCDRPIIRYFAQSFGFREVTYFPALRDEQERVAGASDNPIVLAMTGPSRGKHSSLPEAIAVSRALEDRLMVHNSRTIAMLSYLNGGFALFDTTQFNDLPHDLLKRGTSFLLRSIGRLFQEGI
jgi:hypothetical protein